jgi:hypothetical protein
MALAALAGPLPAAEDAPAEKFERGGFSKQSHSVDGASSSSVEFGESREGKLQNLQIEGTPGLRTVPAAMPASVCQSRIAISYVQLGEWVDIESSVEGVTCAPSHGQFNLRIRTRDRSNRIIDQDITEHWQNTSTDTITVADLYEIGADQDLVRVSVHTSPETACLCGGEAGRSPGAMVPGLE